MARAPGAQAPAAGGSAQPPGGAAWPPDGAAYGVGGAAGWPPAPGTGQFAGPVPWPLADGELLALPGAAGQPAVATVRVEVADASNCPPRPWRADDDDTHGRGLELVDGLADRWGWKPEGNGKSIWCEVDRQAPAAPPAATAHTARYGAEPAGAASEAAGGGAQRSAAGGPDGCGAASAAPPGATVGIERAVSLAGAWPARRRAAH
ncbi:ATP-binding protein [Streptomyces sp. 796.1]|uniref:ATP-binding protein n=1 Tax=Streptomyces sp. 796.1 TaxID=3163029 RepID=UPI0039C8E10A